MGELQLLLVWFGIYYALYCYEHLISKSKQDYDNMIFEFFIGYAFVGQASNEFIEAIDQNNIRLE